MERKAKETTDNDGPCWEDYPPLLTIAQAAAIMRAHSLRRAAIWLHEVGLVRSSVRGNRVKKAELRRRLQLHGPNREKWV